MRFAGAVLTVAVCLHGLAPRAAHAQSPSATLTGLIQDETGAALANVRVIVEHLTTGLQRQTATTDAGRFVFPLLPPGRYVVTAQRGGFAPARVKAFALGVNEQAAIRLELKVASIGEAVSVTAEPSRLRGTAAVGTLVDARLIERMPMNGRSLQALIALTPGVVPTRAINTNFEGQFSVNGQRANANAFLIDGVSGNVATAPGYPPGQPVSGTLPGLSALGTTASLVSIDALSEFEVQTSTTSAAFGRMPGGQISLVTRSGTNLLHGSAFASGRDDALAANDWFAQRTGQRATFRQRNFGGVLGGPLVIPRLFDGHNRAFFFMASENLRLSQPRFTLTSVPSQLLRTLAAEGVQPLLRAFPEPNGHHLGAYFGQRSSTYADRSRVESSSLRLDWTARPDLTLFGRWSRTPSRSAVRDARNAAAIRSTRSDMRTLTLGATAGVRGLVGDLRLNYTTNHGEIQTAFDDFGGAVPPPRSVLLPLEHAPPGTSSIARTTFWMTDGVRAELEALDRAMTQRQVQLVSTVGWRRPTQHLEIGVDYRRLSPVLEPVVYGLHSRFNSIGEMRFGFANSAAVSSEGMEVVPVYSNFSLFAQDTWAATSRLTVEAGVRWEVNPPPDEARGHDPRTIEGLDNLATARPAPPGTPLWRTRYANVAPRLGTVYRLWDRPGVETILRTGLGLFYDTGQSQGSAGFEGPGFASQRRLQSIWYPLVPADVAPLPVGTTDSLSGMTAFAPDLALPYTWQWNVTVEQALGRRQALTLSYVGARGRRLLLTRGIDLRGINPDIPLLYVVENSGSSDYQGLQAQFQRRLSGGLQALASYTWSHAIDVASSDDRFARGDLAAVGSDAPLGSLARRGNSDFDVRHVMSAAISYDVPVMGRHPLVRAAIGGWGLDVRAYAQSGLPISLTAGAVRRGSAANIWDIDLPLVGQPFHVWNIDIVPGEPFYLDDPEAPGGRRLNRRAFERAQSGDGTLPRNVLRSFGASQVDLALRRHIGVGGPFALQLRADIFNLFNQRNFGAFESDLTIPWFGEATSMLSQSLGGLSPAFQVGGPRTAQLTLKILF